MDANSMKQEGAAYITAVNIKEAFEKDSSSQDMHPDSIDKAILRVEKQRDSLEACCEKIADEDLLREFAQFRREINIYASVLRNLQQLPQTETVLAAAIRYYLAPEEEVEPPGHSQQQEVRKLLTRICGFSQRSSDYLNKNFKKRDAFEKERQAKGSKGKEGKKGGGGFLKRLGF